MKHAPRIKSWSHKQSHAYIRRLDGWLDGIVFTPHGIVHASSTRNAPRPASTYRIIIDGRMHERAENVERTERGLSIVAGRFAREVANG